MAAQWRKLAYCDEVVLAPATPEKGDVLYYDGSVYAVLHHGSAGQVLTTGGDNTTPTWETNAASSGATVALDNLASVAINTSLISDTNATDDLGSTASGWLHLYLSTGGVINFLNGAVTLTHSANTLTFGGSAFTTLDLAKKLVLGLRLDNQAEASPPNAGTEVEGQMYYGTTLDHVYVWAGS